MVRGILTFALGFLLVALWATTAAGQASDETWPAAQVDHANSSGVSTIQEPGEDASVDGAPAQDAGNTKKKKDPCSDPKKKKKLAAAVKGAYKGVFYDNRFDYLCDPCYNGCHFGEALKRQCVSDCVVVDLGGEYRVRGHSEHNLRGRPLSGRNDDFLLRRLRLYSNLEIGHHFRIFAEAIDASSSQHRFQPRGIEVNRFDATNLFADAYLWDACCNKMGVRVGRQELLYGAQRLISPLDWSNTRRTFDGAKLMYEGQAWNIDAFWAHPIPFGQHLPRDHNFDRPDNSREFVGVYASYKGLPKRHFDVYFLRLEENDAVVTGENGAAGGFDANLFGLRTNGKLGCWEWELEGGYQFGEFVDDDISAGFCTVGLGRKFESWAWKPMLWGYFDWSSGDDNPGDGDRNTFMQYFPLGHKYLGFMDIVGRQNITDLNFLLITHPHKKVKFLTWWHLFNLQHSRDALYNAGGAAIYRDATGSAGGWIGHELDLALVWTPCPRTNVTFGYSHFWTGSFFDAPAIRAAGATGADADFFYTQVTTRF